ncbi:MAG: cereblon family protein [Polyangiaceae bacterium]
MRCAQCRSAVARVCDRVERFGASEHDRVNPAGFVFRIACYARADGARPEGPASLEFAWFPRAAWRVGLCAACGAHLGWFFGGDAPFVGLRVDAVID